MTPTPIAVDAAGAAALCGFFVTRVRDRQAVREGNAALIRTLYRNGSFPAPIDPDISPRLWRWSVRVITEYVEGQAG